jgi:hypothetical protein
MDIIAIPEFVDVEIDGKVRTAIKLVIMPRGEDTAPIEPAPVSDVVGEIPLEEA